jgi:hypothetical protein
VAIRPEQVQEIRDNVREVLSRVPMKKLKQHVDAQTKEYKKQISKEVVDVAPDEVVGALAANPEALTKALAANPEALAALEAAIRKAKGGK